MLQSGNSTQQTSNNNVKTAISALSDVLLGNTSIATVEEQFTGKVQENKDSIFYEEPVDIETFLYHPEYLGLNITLSKPQLEFVDNIRIVYLLWCLNSPQDFFKMAKNSFIDLINVAPTSDIARNIYFATLTNIVKDSPLFRNKIDANMTSSVINFPKNIRLISGNSENESWQGYTPILIILDEIDAFKSEMELQRSKSLRSEGAEGVYATAKSLVQSRFPGVGKIVSLSWPRFKGSFIQRRFAAGKLEEKTYVACREDGDPYATWDFNPSKNKEDFADFYITDPVLAQARFECNPPYARDAFIKDPVPVLRAFDAELLTRVLGPGLSSLIFCKFFLSISNFSSFFINLLYFLRIGDPIVSVFICSLIVSISLFIFSKSNRFFCVIPSVLRSFSIALFLSNNKSIFPAFSALIKIRVSASNFD